MIIDCFPFFDELDLLEIRLNELKDVVDVFVLTESPWTFSGIEKPLFYRENKDRFKGFKIIEATYYPTGKCIPTEYEKRQKQYNLDYAYAISESGSVYIQGDCDEIPKADVLKKALEEKWESARLVMTMFYYWMNCKEVETKRVWKNTMLFRKDRPVEYNGRQNYLVDRVYKNAGWHFSFLGDVKEKLRSWGHSEEYNKPPFNTDEYIKQCKETGKDLFARKGKRRINFEFTQDLSYLPEYVKDNLDRFRKYIWTPQ